MKVFLLSVLTLGLSFFGMAQTYITGNPPGVEWSKTDLWPVNPIVYNTPYPNGMPAEKSGEDWYYDVEKKRNTSTGAVDGYLFSGYCSMPDFNVDNYPMSMMDAWDECGHSRSNQGGCEDLRRYDPLNPQYNLLMGEPMPIVTVTDLNGNYNPITDYRILPMSGSVHKIIQANDGGYIVLGVSLYHSSFNIVNGQIQGLTKILYNPGYSLSDNTFGCNDGSWNGGIGFAAKLNSDLSTAWVYFYGMNQEANSNALGGISLNDIEPCTGGYVIVGRDDNSNTSMLVKINNNGQIYSGWPIAIPAMESINSIKRKVEGGMERFYLLGGKTISGYFNPVVSKIAESGTVFWTTNLVNPEFLWPNNLVITTLGDVVVSYRGNSIPTTCSLVKLNSSSGSILNTFVDNNSNLKAQDLKYTVIATSDGGCAVSGTVQRYPINNWNTSLLPSNYPPGITTPSCVPDIFRWNTDAYVAKFSSKLVRIWSTVFDANTATPSGTGLDILSQCSSTGNAGCPIGNWQIPNQLGLDVSRQECIFDLEETPDGGFILAGKNSRNLDDCYIVKLCASGQPIVLQNLIIDDAREYRNTSITVNNSSFTSISRTELEACKFVTFEPNSTVETQSVLLASINTVGCCDAQYAQGFRMDNAIVEEPLKNEKVTNWQVESLVTPNPNKGSFNYSMSFSTDELVTIDVVNSFGVVVYCRSNISCKSGLSLDINLDENLPSGIYYVKAYTKDRLHFKKIIIQ